jgi:O-glycosyl hydrolase
MATNMSKRRSMALVVAMACAGTPAVAQNAQDAELQALERGFWRCDHATAHGALDSGSAMRCSLIYEALKERRFGGDFTAMLAWWREHKGERHGALDRAAAAPGPTTARQ